MLLHPAGATATYSLFGAVPIPANLMPLGALVFTSVILPQASFLGHLAGLVAGYVMAFLPTVPSLAILAIFVCFLGAVAWSLHRQFGSVHFERLRSYLPLRSSDDDVELG
jgi:ABC-type proline/glycine betaine transport system permease subunit